MQYCLWWPEDSRGKGDICLEPKIKILLCYIIYDYERQKPFPAAAKMIADYDPSYELVIQYLMEKILARDPDFPEALLLKARILWEG